MADRVPLAHQLDALRMDVQYVLRFVQQATDRGKAWRSRPKDTLAAVLFEYGLTRPYGNDEDFKLNILKPQLFAITRLGRKVVDNDHALREIAIHWMDSLDEEQLLILQHGITKWPFRDPHIRKFMVEADGVEGGPALDDFFPQAPWYWHTVGKNNVPRFQRDREAEEEYIKGGYTGKETSAFDIVHPDG